MIVFPTPFLARANIMRGPLNFMVMADTSGTPDLAISSDARAWFRVKWPAPAGYTRSLEMSFCDGKFFIWCRNAATGSSGAVYTENGRDWYFVEIDNNATRFPTGITKLSSGFWIAFGSSTTGRRIWTSTNFQKWTDRSDSVATNQFRDGASIGSLVALLADTRAIVTTTDGSTFTQRSSGLTGDGSANFLDYLNGNLIAGGSNTGLISVSTTGTSWATKNTGLAGAPQFAAFGAGVYVVARSEEIRVSADLTAWDAATTIPAEWDASLRGMGFVDGEFILASSHAETVFIRSDDGLNFETFETNLPFPQARIFVARQ
jgi:hypothetical protein